MIEVTEAYLTPNQWSRPQIQLRQVHGLIMHYVANPGTSAWFNRNYFESRRRGKLGYGSAHFIIDLSGEVLVCIPPTEVAYHCGEDRPHGFFYTDLAVDQFGHWPNGKTLSIEMCHLDNLGRFSEDTWISAERLCACLCEQHNLDPMYNIFLHWHITKKLCPRFFVDHPIEFERFKQGAKRRMLNDECMTGGN